MTYRIFEGWRNRLEIEFSIAIPKSTPHNRTTGRAVFSRQKGSGSSISWKLSSSGSLHRQSASPAAADSRTSVHLLPSPGHRFLCLASEVPWVFDCGLGPLLMRPQKTNEWLMDGNQQFILHCKRADVDVECQSTILHCTMLFPLLSLNWQKDLRLCTEGT